MSFKEFLKRILAIVILFVSVAIFNQFLQSGENAATGEFLGTIVYVFAIVCVIYSLFSDKFSVKDTLISVVFYGAIAYGVNYAIKNSSGKLGNVLGGLLLAGVGGIEMYINSGYFSNRNVHKLGPVGMFLANLLELIMGATCVLASFDFIKPEITAVIGKFAIPLCVIAGIIIIAGTVLVVAKNGIRKGGGRSAPRTKKTNGDTRAVDKSSFSSILYDECDSICRSFYSTSISHGTFRPKVSVKVSNGEVLYTVGGTVSAKATDQYQVNELKSSLEREIKKIASSCVSQTESRISKLRNKYQNYDGDYSIRAQQGEVKAE